MNNSPANLYHCPHFDNETDHSFEHNKHIKENTTFGKFLFSIHHLTDSNAQSQEDGTRLVTCCAALHYTNGCTEFSVRLDEWMDRLKNKWMQEYCGSQSRVGVATKTKNSSVCFNSKCWDGSQDSKLPLHASHVALPLKSSSNQFHVLLTCKITTATG